jgi:hypothetical protein
MRDDAGDGVDGLVSGCKRKGFGGVGEAADFFK